MTTATSNCPLVCTFVNPESPNDAIPLSFRRDKEKKSAFWLDTTSATTATGDLTTMEGPAHCIIFSRQDNPFALGGFQLVSNSRTVEVYLVEASNKADNNNNKNNGNKEVYLTSCRGIPADGDDNYKVICAIPGGPRAVTTLHLKLKSLKPAKSNTARLCSIKLTARLAETDDSSAAAAASKTTMAPQLPQTSTVQNPPTVSAAMAATTTDSNGNSNTRMRLPPHIIAAANNPSPPTTLTGEDLGAAMAGLSYLVRSTQETLLQGMHKSQQDLQQSMDQRLQGLEHQVQRVQISQQQLLDQQTRLLQEQAAMIQKQGEQLANLLQQQQELLNLMPVVSQVAPTCYPSCHESDDAVGNETDDNDSKDSHKQSRECSKGSDSDSAAE